MDKTLEAPGQSFQYADLNIRHTGDPQKTLAMVKRAIRMGIDSVAINIDIGLIVPSEFVEDHGMLVEEETEAQPPPAKKKKKKGDQRKPREQTIPEPFLLDESLLDTTSLEQNGKKFRQFSRITFTLNDASVIHNVFHNQRLKKYDIVAVRPGDEGILNTLTRKTDTVDLVCYDHEQAKLGWARKGKSMEMIRAEGVGFEICYGPALSDKDARRQVLSHGRSVIRALRGRGIVFSSGAEEVIDLRAPVDAMNMTSLWGVNGADARVMVSGFPRQVLLRAEARRTVRGVLHVTPIDKWEGDDGKTNIDASVPSRSKSHQDALRRLLTVKSFRAQVEVVPNKVESS